ncbi:endonuclease domain-containing protein [Rufibacter quisquiliarum]|uniref:Endogenous inhibitor of DNA gyrase (YacG/DUF329 family) n=1 Tax=Rufibacter quisquiliarum TaxID=1549639 RepID=A0A839G9E4_9BACT|nr:DUF559 domain-containing protein [Rufibacter quisquiliarum]MBA9076104.1 endogenous inhibitor of DNA gyrase (YacG/DUF329 family) [Rufibacter quisquiliarum]
MPKYTELPKKRICKVCNSEFQPVNYSIFCSKKCQESRLSEIKASKKKTITLPCVTCGTTVIASTSLELQYARKGRAYCSEICKKEFIKQKSSKVMAETNRKYASERMRKKNPMHNPEAKAKMKAKLKEIGWKPPVHKGNGHLTEPQKVLAAALNWPMEVAVNTGKRQAGLPTCFKIDIANEELKIAIEVDGGSHHALAIKEQDARKTAFLESLGWKVIRFWNKEVNSNLDECVRRVKELVTSKAA